MRCFTRAVGRVAPTIVADVKKERHGSMQKPETGELHLATDAFAEYHDKAQDQFQLRFLSKQGGCAVVLDRAILERLSGQVSELLARRPD